MAIVHLDGEGSINKIEGSKTKNKKPLKIKPVKYKCPTCKDTGLIEVNGLRVKCQCVVKKELKSWLIPPLRNVIRRKGVMIVNKSDVFSPLTGKHTISFKEVPDKAVYELLTKVLLTWYYKNSMIPVPYYVITGNDYTEAYVRGEHNKYLDVYMLTLFLGHDNKNVTLDTTIKSIIQYRTMRELPTWVILKEGVSHSKLSELYGIDFMDYLDNNINLSVVKHGRGLKLIKKKDS